MRTIDIAFLESVSPHVVLREGAFDDASIRESHALKVHQSTGMLRMSEMARRNGVSRVVMMLSAEVVRVWTKFWSCLH